MGGASVRANVRRRRVGGPALRVDDTSRAREWAEKVERVVERAADHDSFAAVHIREVPGGEPPDGPAVVFHFDRGASAFHIRHALCYCTSDVTPALLRYLFEGRGMIAIDDQAKTVAFGGAIRALSGQQIRLIKELNSARGAWLSRAALLHRAFDTKHDEQSSIVRVHMHGLRAALGEFAPLVRSLHGVGYRLQIPRPLPRTASGVRPAEGSSFELDCRRDPGQSECTRACGRGVRVVIVDDDAICARALARALVAHGFECDMVEWWSGARRAFSDGYDVAVVDVFLGDHSGVTLAREMLDVGACRSVVLVSAYPGLVDLALPSLPGVLLDKGDGDTAVVHAVLSAAGRQGEAAIRKPT